MSAAEFVSIKKSPDTENETADVLSSTPGEGGFAPLLHAKKAAPFLSEASLVCREVRDTAGGTKLFFLSQDKEELLDLVLGYLSDYIEYKLCRSQQGLEREVGQDFGQSLEQRLVQDLQQSTEQIPEHNSEKGSRQTSGHGLCRLSLALTGGRLGNAIALRLPQLLVRLQDRYQQLSLSSGEAAQENQQARGAKKTHELAGEARAHRTHRGCAQTSAELSDAPLSEAAPMAPERASKLWDLIEWWVGDERLLDADDPQRNDQQILSAFQQGCKSLDPKLASELSTSFSAHFHSLAKAKATESETKKHQRQLEKALPTHFDFVFLSLGEDGHIASLFPEHPSLISSNKKICLEKNSPKAPPRRLSFTLDYLAKTECICFLASGKEKQAALEKTLLGHASMHFPASELSCTSQSPGAPTYQGANGRELHNLRGHGQQRAAHLRLWFLDQAATSEVLLENSLPTTCERLLQHRFADRCEHQSSPSEPE